MYSITNYICHAIYYILSTYVWRRKWQHSSVLAWRIPGTGEPDGLLSMGSHRVGHDLSDLAAAAATHTLLPRQHCRKESACPCRRCQFDPCFDKIPWRRKCNPLQYSCLENSMDGAAWWATVHEVAKESDMTEHLNNNSFKYNF